MVDRQKPDPVFVKIMDDVRANENGRADQIVDLLGEVERTVRASYYEDSSPGFLLSYGSRPLKKLIDLCGVRSDVVKRCLRRIVTSPYDGYGYCAFEVRNGLKKCGRELEV